MKKDVEIPQPVPLECLQATGKILLDSDKTVFGPMLWHLLHKQAARSLSPEWLDAFEAAIPCPFCRAHFQELRRKTPMDAFVSPEAWAWTIHNLVNSNINRPVISLDEARHIHAKK